MQGDTLQPAYPQNTHRQDWAYYPFVGGSGGVSPTTTGVTRWPFWVEFDPFDVKNLKITAENISFQIFDDSFLSEPLIPYVLTAQSNDITDEIIEANLPISPGQVNTVDNAEIAYPPFGFIDDGSFVPFTGVPPVSSAVSAPTNLTISSSEGGTLVAGQTYYYCITALVGAVESLPSQVVSFTAIEDYQEAVLSFTNTPAGATSYNIYRNTTNSFTSGSLLLTNSYLPGQPPYYMNVTFLQQPVDSNFTGDQGFWTFDGYSGNGVSFGAGTMLGQGFVPQQPTLTGFYWGDIFRTALTDHTTYYQLNFELWSSSGTFIQSLGSLLPLFNSSNNNVTLMSSNCTITCDEADFLTADDGNIYWTNLTKPFIKLNAPVALSPGSTYYLMIRQSVQSITAYYSLGANFDNSTIRDYYHYYPFGNGIQATDGSSTFSNLVDNNGNHITFPFYTTGSVGRQTIMFWWKTVGNGASNYWLGTPNNKDFSFLHIDFNQRI